MARFVSDLDILTGRVKLVEKAGIALPDRFIAVRQRLTDWQGLRNATPCRDRLVAAAADPDSLDDIPALRAAAHAEATASPKVSTAVLAGFHRALREAWRPDAATVYNQAADMFDHAAEQLAAAAALIDPEADPETVVSESAAKRTAWAAAPLHANDLNRLIDPLRAAAWLAGADTYGSDQLLLALLTDPKNAHRRRIWQAWETRDGRTKRWGALLAAGADLRAHRHLDRLQPYRRPAPLEVTTEVRGGLTFRTTHDPEDHQTAQAG